MIAVKAAPSQMISEKIRVLIVDKSPADVQIYRDLLAIEGESFELNSAGSLEQAQPAMIEWSPDVVLLDMSLYGYAEMDAITLIRSYSPQVPVVVLTGNEDVEMGLRAVHSGAQDYLVKERINSSVLDRVIRYAIERHRLVEELETIRKQQLELKDQFLSHASHELRSPLTTIHQFVSILADGLAGDFNQEQQEYLDIIMRNVLELRGMIGDLLDVTRATSGKLTISKDCNSIMQLIKETVESNLARAATKSIELIWRGSPFICPANIDSKRIRQVLTNLVENALKFTPEGGRVELSAEQNTRYPNMITVSVKDNGCGIRNDGQQHIFERLYQEPNGIEASRRGLGIGLFICRELVSQHGGEIWVESSEGKGSDFLFTVPLYPLSDWLSTYWEQNTTNAGIVCLSLISQEGGEISESARRNFWNTIEGAILPVEEILLPRTTVEKNREICLVITSGMDAEISASGLVSHLRNGFQFPRGMTLDISASLLRLQSTDDNDAIAGALSRSIRGNSFDNRIAGGQLCLQRS